MSRTLQTEVLKGAITILDDERCWCQDAEARTVFGLACDATAWYALQVCAYGALKRSAYRLMKDKEKATSFANNLLQEILKKGGRYLITVNDSQGREVVLKDLRSFAHQ